MLRGNSTAPWYLSNSLDKLKMQGGQCEKEALFFSSFFFVSVFVVLRKFFCPSLATFGFCDLSPELTLSLWYPRDLSPSRGQTHDPVPFDVTLHLGMVAKGTGDSSGKVGNIIHLQQKLNGKKEKMLMYKT